MQEQVGCFFTTNVTNVPTAGVRVQISTSPDRVRRITFKALAGNTGDVYVGGSDVSSSVGFTLAPGESIPLDFDPQTEPLSSFYVDAANNNDKVSWIIGASSASGQLASSHSHDSHTGTLSVNEGGTGATALTDGGVLLGSAGNPVTAMAVLADGEMIVGDGTTDPVAESGDTLRTSIGVGAGQLAITSLDIDGASDIGAAIVDGDLFIIDDGAGGTNRKTAASRILTYVGGLSGTAKAWCSIAISGALESPDFGIASIGDTGTGDRDVNHTTAFSSTVFSIPSSMHNIEASDRAMQVTSRQTADTQVLTRILTTDTVDDESTVHAWFGDQ